MKDAIEAWALAHPYLTFALALILAAPAFLTVYGVLNAAAHILVRGLRLVVVALRGWPPPHLDADGDRMPGTPDRPRTRGCRTCAAVADFLGSEEAMAIGYDCERAAIDQTHPYLHQLHERAIRSARGTK